MKELPVEFIKELTLMTIQQEVRWMEYDEKMEDFQLQKYLDEIVTCQTDEFREAGRNVTRETNPDDYLQKKVIFYDHPLLFEVPYRIEPADEAWVIDLGEEERIRRVMSRDHISRDQVIQRMHSQMSRSEKLARADAGVQGAVAGKTVVKVICVPKRIVNLVVK